MGLFWTILKGNYHQSFIGIIISIINISIIIAYVRAPLRDDSQDQGLTTVQMLYRHSVKTVLALNSLKYS